MGVTVSWDDEAKTIIRFDFEGQWTWDEFHSIYPQNLAMMDSVNHKIDFIVNMSQSKGLPSGALQQLKRVADMNHPNGGMNIYVGANPLLRAMGQVFLKIYPQSAKKYPFDFAATVEEARAKIAKMRSERQ